jgi:hypothetical protein
MRSLVIVLAALFIAAGMATGVGATIVTIDLSLLPDGDIPVGGYQVGPVHIYNGDPDRPVSIGNNGTMYFFSGRNAIFDFSVPVTQIWATIGSNSATMTVTAMVQGEAIPSAITAPGIRVQQERSVALVRSTKWMSWGTRVG